MTCCPSNFITSIAKTTTEDPCIGAWRIVTDLEHLARVAQLAHVAQVRGGGVGESASEHVSPKEIAYELRGFRTVLVL